MGGGGAVLVVYLALRGSLGALDSLRAGQWGWIIVSGTLLAAYVATWFGALARARALDVTSVLVLRSVVHSLAREGKIILYSSHILEVVEKVCSRVIILHKGRVVANENVSRLRDLMHSPSLEDVFSQLVLEEDTEQVAKEIVATMKM